jgi:hypothetical protein
LYCYSAAIDCGANMEPNAASIDIEDQEVTHGLNQATKRDVTT